MTQISPEGAADLSLIRALRPPNLAPPPETAPRPTGTQPEIRALRNAGSAAGSSTGTGQLPRQDAIATLTRTDSFAGGDHSVLTALQHLLRESLTDAGPLNDLAERLIDRLSALLPPETPNPGTPPKPDPTTATRNDQHPAPAQTGSPRSTTTTSETTPRGTPQSDTVQPGTTQSETRDEAAGQPGGGRNTTDPGGRGQHGTPGSQAPRPFMPVPTGAPMAPGPQPILVPTLPVEIPAQQSQQPQPDQSAQSGGPQAHVPQAAVSSAAPGSSPAPGFGVRVGAWAPPVHLEGLGGGLPTVIVPPVHPPNLPATPSDGDGSASHEALLVPAPAGPPIIALAAKTVPPTMHDLRIMVAGDPRVRREQVGQALSWLVENLDQAQVVAARCAELGPALQQVGASAQRLDAMGVLVADALRATFGGAWRPEHYDAWRSSARLVTSWMGQGMERTDYEPAFWTATVVGHERRGDDGALLHVRTYLPYPFLPGQFATVESARHPQLWHPYWIAGLPSDDNTVALEVRGAPDDLVAHALVNATTVGDRVRLRPAGGGLTLDRDSDADLLLIAHGTGIAPMKALLADLRHYREVRGVHLLWTVDRGDHLDVEELREVAGPDATLARLDDREHLAAAVADGVWDGYEVYVNGSPDEVRDTVTMLEDAHVSAERIHRAALEGPEFEPIIIESG